MTCFLSVIAAVSVNTWPHRWESELNDSRGHKSNMSSTETSREDSLPQHTPPIITLHFTASFFFFLHPADTRSQTGSAYVCADNLQNGPRGEVDKDILQEEKLLTKCALFKWRTCNVCAATTQGNVWCCCVYGKACVYAEGVPWKHLFWLPQVVAKIITSKWCQTTFLGQERLT